MDGTAADPGWTVLGQRGGKRGAMAATTSWYSRLSKKAAHFCGRPQTFVFAVGVVVLWLVTGPLFGFSDTWQLIINTGTTIVTFLMVFLIQSTQNRDTEAMQIKLDELIRITQGAHNALLDLEELDEAELEKFRDHYLMLAEAARAELKRGEQDTDTPEM
jgi:low affinity Fe/Cu permease